MTPAAFRKDVLDRQEKQWRLLGAKLEHMLPGVTALLVLTYEAGVIVGGEKVVRS